MELHYSGALFCDNCGSLVPEHPTFTLLAMGSKVMCSADCSEEYKEFVRVCMEAMANTGTVYWS